MGIPLFSSRSSSLQQTFSCCIVPLRGYALRLSAHVTCQHPIKHGPNKNITKYLPLDYERHPHPHDHLRAYLALPKTGCLGWPPEETGNYCIRAAVYRGFRPEKRHVLARQLPRIDFEKRDKKGRGNSEKGGQLYIGLPGKWSVMYRWEYIYQTSPGVKIDLATFDTQL